MWENNTFSFEAFLKVHLLRRKQENAVWQIEIQHIPCLYSHVKRYFQHFRSKTSNKNILSHILRMPNNHFIHVSVLTYKDMTCLCCVVSLSKRTEDNSLLRKSVGLSASLPKKKMKKKKKKKLARCSWLRTLEKILKMTEKSMMFWLFCSHYDIEQYAAKSYCSKVLQDHLLAE